MHTFWTLLPHKLAPKNGRRCVNFRIFLYTLYGPKKGSKSRDFEKAKMRHKTQFNFVFSSPYFFSFFHTLGIATLDHPQGSQKYFENRRRMPSKNLKKNGKLGCTSERPKLHATRKPRTNIQTTSPSTLFTSNQRSKLHLANHT